MRHNKIQIPLFFLFCFFMSCKHDTGASYRISLVYAKQVVLTLDNETAKTSKCIMPFDNQNSQYLVYLNDQKPSLLFFDLSNQKLIKTLLLQKDGPEGVGHIKGFFVKNPDSIFVLNPQAYNLSLIDKNGKLINHYLLIKNAGAIGKPSLSSVSMPVMYTGQSPQLSGNNIDLVCLPDMLPFKQQAYTSGNLNITLDLNTKDFTYSNKYPSSYTSKNYSYISSGVYRCTDKDGDMLYSYAGCDSIYCYKNNHLKASYFAGSKYFDDVKSLTEPVNETSPQEFMQQPVLNSFYHYILYDKYRKVYYRIACLKKDLKDANNQANNFFDKPFSIIILNDKFKIIGEQVFSDSKYDLLNMFVGKEGLYISESFYKNVSDNENLLKYSVFKLKI